MISRRYARALLKFASERGQLERVYAESRVFGARLAASGQLRRVLTNVTLGDDRKYGIAEAFAGGEISEEFGRFLRLVIKQRREDCLLIMMWDFQAMVREKLRLLEAEVTTAVEVDDATRRKISDELASMVDATVDLKTKVDPSIVGGYVLRWDSFRLDASVRGKLERLRETLTDSK